MMTVTKEADMGKKVRKAMAAPAEEAVVSEGAELPERWSVQRKMELVLRLLRGEALDAVSRESQIPAHELESWKRVFLDTGTRGLKTRAEPEERELTLARAKIGELMMRLELAEHLIEKRGFADEWRKSRR
jgi:transposase